MSLIVQKYGGSSVATPARIRAVAQRVKSRWQAGDRLVVVVSAMGDTTDDLLALSKMLNSEARGREVDLLVSTGEIVSCSLLALALQAVGVPAHALTGAQAGIFTDGNFSRASIADLKPDRLWATLGAGEIPIVAGFQGISANAAGPPTPRLPPWAGAARTQPPWRWPWASRPTGAKSTRTWTASSRPTPASCLAPAAYADQPGRDARVGPARRSGHAPPRSRAERATIPCPSWWRPVSATALGRG